MSTLNFNNSSTHSYCSDKFTISYNKTTKKVETTPKNQVDPLHINSELKTFENHALEAYRRAFQDFKPQEIAFCFDGGKDGHVVFHLLKNFILSLNQPETISEIKKSPILIINIVQNSIDLLAEPRNLVIKLTQQFSEFIKYQEYTNLDIKSALYKLKEDHSDIKAIFMGVRRTDNVWYKNMKIFQKTDQGWPEYVRINPIVDWSYPCVWAYLLKYKIGYCELYDEGYTSLGKKSNSVRNEHLKVEVDGENFFLPAFCLPSAEFERFKR